MAKKTLAEAVKEGVSLDSAPTPMEDKVVPNSDHKLNQPAIDQTIPSQPMSQADPNGDLRKMIADLQHRLDVAEGKAQAKPYEKPKPVYTDEVKEAAEKGGYLKQKVLQEKKVEVVRHGDNNKAFLVEN